MKVCIYYLKQVRLSCETRFLTIRFAHLTPKSLHSEFQNFFIRIFEGLFRMFEIPTGKFIRLNK